MKAKSQGTLYPTHPRTKPDLQDQSRANYSQTDHKGKIEPEINNFTGNLQIQVPALAEMEKFGGKRRSRISTETPKHN